MHNDSMVVLHKICEIPRTVWKNDFRFCWRLEKLPLTSCRLLRSFGCTRIWLCALSGEILHHDCVSVIVSRFTFWTFRSAVNKSSFFIEVLLRQCFFCKEPLSSWFVSILRNFFFGKWAKRLCFLDATFAGRSESESWEMCAGAGTSVSSKFSMNSSNHGKSRNRFPDAQSLSLFFILSGGSCVSRQFPGAPSSAVATGTRIWRQSWDNRVRKFPSFYRILFPCLVRCDWLAHSHVYPCSLQSSPSDGTEGVSSNNSTLTKRSRL